MKKKINHDHENGRFQTQQSSSPALKLKRNRGEIGERKDRHSKVCTAKGPRDRRLRLSAHTAIQFYDFQDRLGCGRPSEAIDWLMKEAKAAIDALHELPITAATVPSADQKTEQGLDEDGLNHNHEIDSHQHFNQDSIDGFRSQSHGFCLSLQSCQNPNWPNPQTLFSASASLDFEATPTNWSNPETLEIGQSQRVITWTSNSSSGKGEGREGFVVNSAALWRQTGLGLNQFLSQGGTLQSSYPPSIPDSMNPQLSNLNYDQICALGPFSGTGNLITGDEFSVSPRIQEEEEKQNAVPNKPSSASVTCLLHYQNW